GRGRRRTVGVRVARRPVEADEVVDKALGELARAAAAVGVGDARLAVARATATAARLLGYAEGDAVDACRRRQAVRVDHDVPAVRRLRPDRDRLMRRPLVERLDDRPGRAVEAGAREL